MLHEPHGQDAHATSEHGRVARATRTAQTFPPFFFSAIRGLSCILSIGCSICTEILVLRVFGMEVAPSARAPDESWLLKRHF